MMRSEDSSSKLVATFVIVSVLLLSHGETEEFKSAGGLRFETLAVKTLTEKEDLKQCPHAIGMGRCVSVRFRLSSADGRGVYFFTFENWAVPMGYHIKVGKKYQWLWGDRGAGLRDTSPGPDMLVQGAPSHWILLPAGSSIEWEVTDSTQFANETHSYSVFVSTDRGKKPEEIFSTPYTVPNE